MVKCFFGGNFYLEYWAKMDINGKTEILKRKWRAWDKKCDKFLFSLIHYKYKKFFIIFIINQIGQWDHQAPQKNVYQKKCINPMIIQTHLKETNLFQKSHLKMKTFALPVYFKFPFIRMTVALLNAIIITMKSVLKNGSNKKILVVYVVRKSVSIRTN